MARCTATFERIEWLTKFQFEDNNVSIQNIGLVQALILTQDVALWSGNRRKMEIAECHLVIPVTVRASPCLESANY